MGTIDLHSILRMLASEAEPTEAQKEGARRSHNALRDSLDSGNIGKRIVQDFLSGSYSRHTAVAPLDDVDIIFVIDPTEWPPSFWRSLPVPEKVLETFHGAIKYRYPESGVRVQRRSVGLQMYHLAIDAVPAIRANQPKTLMIPDVKKDRWIKTAPEKHAEIATELNAAMNGMFKPLVKLLKGWNGTLADGARLKSFAIETACVRLFRSTRVQDLFDGALHFFDFLAWSYRAQPRFAWNHCDGLQLRYWGDYEIRDSAETGSNVIEGLTASRRDKFLTAAVRARENLFKAERARSAITAEEHARAALRA